MPANANSAHQSNASRLRGGGAAKDCCVGILGAFVCLECCEVSSYSDLLEYATVLQMFFVAHAKR
ncbi:hypothetical protein BDZ97DRAFT_1920131 [Flammula alnicola]|nr:hypothetical protein BDZ97DRAFT_1920131 [Flammula alnicola]